MTATASGVRCATWAREVDLEPAGTAPSCEVIVLVEHPLPWPGDIADDSRLASLLTSARAAADGRSVRLQAVACDAGVERRRVVVFAGGDTPFAGFGRLEAAATDPSQLGDVVASLVSADTPLADPGVVTDVLICTHGSRDTCCGSLGTRLWLDAETRVGAAHVWRVSHTGGHRFAPTVVTLPDGNAWAHVDADILEGIVSRTLPAQQAARHLRGCVRFTPAQQVADRAIFAERGWDWLRCERFIESRSPHRLEVCFATPEGVHGTYDVVLEEGRRVPTPDCGGDPATATKAHTELRVAQLTEWRA